MSNVNAVKAGLYAALAGDSTLTAFVGSDAVYDGVAPQGKATPYIIFQKLTGVASYAFSGLAFDTHTFLVKAVDEDPSAATVGSIAERIDAVLTDQDITLSSGTIMVLRRQQDIDYPEVADGRTFRHVGALYTVGVT